MTELQQLRKALMKTVKEIEEGEADEEQAKILVSVSNSIIKSYNVELRADELELKGKETKDSLSHKVFKEV